MIGYAKFFDNAKTMSPKVNDKKLLRNYIKKWEKISYLMNIKSDCETVYGGSVKYIKTKIKTHEDKVHTTNLYKLYKCLSLLMLDFVIGRNRKYYPQTLLEECKYDIKNNKAEKLINYDFDTSSSDESDSESDNESDNESEKPSKKSHIKSEKSSKKYDNNESD